MKILFLNAYFKPEQIAFTHLEDDLISGLVEAGHQIEVVCPTPTRGISKETAREYRGKKTENLYGGKVHVTRFLAPQEGNNTIIRALRYFWCNLRTYQIGKKANGVDVVFANSTPPTQGLIAGKVAKKLKVPFVFSLQDFFPDSLVNAGMTRKGSLVWKIGRWIENYTYSHANKIIVISERFKRIILAKGVPEEKTVVVSNWVDMDAVMPIEQKSNTLFDELGINRSKFVVVYAGNIGETQGADVIIDAAKELKTEPNIQFVIFGGGARYQAIKDRVEKEKIGNVFITDLQPQERVSEVYSMGDVALITCKPGTGNAGLPSKTWSIMACNTTIIASFDADSDLAEALEKSGAGICVEPGSTKALSNAIKLVYEMWRIDCKLDIDTRSYAIQNASKKMCVKKYIETISNVTDYIRTSELR